MYLFVTGGGVTPPSRILIAALIIQELPSKRQKSIYIQLYNHMLHCYTVSSLMQESLTKLNILNK